MKHTKETHPKTAMLYRSIFKCPLCDTVFHDKESPNVAKHLMEHAKSFQATVFHCLVCPEVFDTTSELAEHLSSGEQKEMLKLKLVDLSSITTRFFFIQTNRALNHGRFRQDIY